MNKRAFWVGLWLGCLLPFLAAESLTDGDLLQLIEKMTLEEKVSLVHANAVFENAGVPRLGIPPLVMSDGPHGVRWETAPMWRKADHPHNSVTSFPTLSALAATWNRELAYRYGKALGAEFYSRGKSMALGPGVNLMRTPLNGRNFEYMGEDPFLSGEMAAAEISGLQSRGVAACVKHFACNNQETARTSVSVEADERALRELYLPAFEWAVKKGGALAVMPAYNRFRGRFCAENRPLLDGILREEWGFSGVAVSDWGAVHSTEGAQAIGLDLEMGTYTTEGSWNRYYLAAPYLAGLKSGRYSEADLNRKVYHLLYLMKRIGLLGQTAARLSSDRGINLPEHQQVALETARESIVLLQNKRGVLPFPQADFHLLVVGENADAIYSDSGGSSNVQALYEKTLLQGLREVTADFPSVSVEYLPGTRGPWLTAGGAALAQRLQRADGVVLALGTQHDWSGFGESEGLDRRRYDLPPSQIRLLKRLLRLRPDTVVTVTAGTPVGFGGMGEALSTLLYSWYNGCENGRALAEVLFGKVNPSGRLPFTVARRLSDYPAHANASRYPGKGGTVSYDESLQLGYRYFDRASAEPLFPFGAGLSYAEFRSSKPLFSRLPDGSALVSCRVENVGDLSGKTVVSLYVGDPEASLYRPLKELKAFEKVRLEPGEAATVDFVLNRDAFSFYDPEKPGWRAEAGRFVFSVTLDSRRWEETEAVISDFETMPVGFHS